MFCKCFAKSLIAARSPKSTSGAIEKLWRRRPKKFAKSMKKTLQKRLAARSHRSSKKRAEMDGNGGPETLKSELGRPTVSGKACPGASGAFKKKGERGQATSSAESTLRKRSLDAQCPECSRPSKENLLKDICIYIYIYEPTD